EGDPETEYAQGKLHFTLHGQKLKGEWVLVRRGGRPDDHERGDPWFFFKVRDDEAIEGDEAGLLEREPNSVSTGRTMDEMAAGKKAHRRARPQSHAKSKAAGSAKSTNGKRPSSAAPPERRDPQSRKKLLAALTGAKQSPLPAKIKPQLATLV